MAGARIVGTRIGAVPRPGQRRHPPAGLGADWLVSAWDQHAAFAEHGRRRSPPNRLPVAGSSTCWIFPETPPWGSRRVPRRRTRSGCSRPAIMFWLRTASCRTNRARRGPTRRPDRKRRTAPSVARSARVIGLGSDAIVPVPSDSSGAMDPDAVRAAILGHAGPLIVNAQAAT